MLGKARREILDKVMEEMQDHGIEFSDHPEFSNQYHLHAANPEAVKTLFRHEVRELFQRQEKPLPSVEKAGGWLAVYRKDTLVKPEDVMVALEEARAIRAFFPP